MITRVFTYLALVAAGACQHQGNRRRKRCGLPRVVRVMLATVVLSLGAGSVLAFELPAMPLAERYEDSIRQRWAGKEVLASRVFDGMESATDWEHSGFGGIILGSEPVRQGAHSLTLVSPTKGERPGGTPGRPFGEARLTRIPVIRSVSARWR